MGCGSGEAARDARYALYAEQRATVRATIGARYAKASCEKGSLNTPYVVNLRMQAKMALQAAFPDNREISHQTQDTICRSIADGSLFDEKIVVAIPLSSTPLLALLGGEAATDGGSSTANSSSFGSASSFGSVASRSGAREDEVDLFARQYVIVRSCGHFRSFF